MSPPDLVQENKNAHWSLSTFASIRARERRGDLGTWGPLHVCPACTAVRLEFDFSAPLVQKSPKKRGPDQTPANVEFD